MGAIIIITMYTTSSAPTETQSCQPGPFPPQSSSFSEQGHPSVRCFRGRTDNNNPSSQLPEFVPAPPLLQARIQHGLSSTPLHAPASQASTVPRHHRDGLPWGAVGSPGAVPCHAPACPRLQKVRHRKFFIKQVHLESLGIRAKWKRSLKECQDWPS